MLVFKGIDKPPLVMATNPLTGEVKGSSALALTPPGRGCLSRDGEHIKGVNKLHSVFPHFENDCL